MSNTEVYRQKTLRQYKNCKSIAINMGKLEGPKKAWSYMRQWAKALVYEDPENFDALCEITAVKDVLFDLRNMFKPKVNAKTLAKLDERISEIYEEYETRMEIAFGQYWRWTILS